MEGSHRVNLLVSEAYLCKSRDMRVLAKALAHRGHAVLIDSGAFTNLGVERKGKEPIVRLDDYCNVCLSEYANWAWGYIALDVVGDEAASRENLATMCRRGLRPIPVLTADAPLEQVPELVAIDKRLMVAGAVFGRRQWVRNRMRRVFDASGGAARIHALGYCRLPDVFTAPIASCDSSSPFGGRQFGTFPLYSRTQGFTGYTRSTIGDKLTMQYLARCNVPSNILHDPRTWRRNGRNYVGEIMAVAAYSAMHDHLMQLGIRWFMAASAGVNQLACAVAVYHAMRPDGTFDYKTAMTLWQQIEAGECVPYRDPFHGSACWDDPVGKEA